jgi:methyltransferase (TIGR00027 family)
MEKGKSRLIAKGIAAIRAVESMKPEGERLFYDPYAKGFAGRSLVWINKFFMGYAKRAGPGLWEFIVSRVRYIDDFLQKCIREGIQQLVILGAGYDSRAYRIEELKKGIKVFEVDRPAAMKDKKAKLEKIFGKLPDHVKYVPVDFDKESLEEQLIENGYDKNLKTLFILEGVTYYISQETADNILSFVAKKSGEESSIIFDYIYIRAISGEQKRGEITRMKRYRRFTGERIVFGVEEGTIKKYLEERDFYKVVNATNEDFEKLYFEGKNINIAPVYAIAHATVKPKSSRL